MNLKRNNTENLLWRSIDALVEEIKAVAIEGQKTVDLWDIMQYTFATLWTAFTQAAREGENVHL